jgi:SPP1 family predicted phage head-tail adaptor
MPLATYPLRANILKPKTAANIDGNPTEAYEPCMRGVPVYFETARGREFWEAKGLHAETVGRIRLRYIDGITPDMRLVLNGRTFEIIPPINNAYERNRELILTVKEVI